MINYIKNKGTKGILVPSRDMPAKQSSNTIIQPNSNSPDFSFKNMDIQAGCGSLHEFERGKKLLRDLDLAPNQYDLLLSELADYIGI